MSSYGGKINKPLRLEDAANLTPELLHKNFNNRILLNFLVKIVNNFSVNFDAF